MVVNVIERVAWSVVCCVLLLCAMYGNRWRVLGGQEWVNFKDLPNGIYSKAEGVRGRFLHHEQCQYNRLIWVSEYETDFEKLPSTFEIRDDGVFEVHRLRKHK